MRAEETASNCGNLGSDLRDGKAGGVGSEKRVWTEMRKDAW